MLENKSHKSLKIIGFSLVEPYHITMFCFSSQSKPSSFLFWISDVSNKAISFFSSTSNLYLLVLLNEWNIKKDDVIFFR